MTVVLLVGLILAATGCSDSSSNGSGVGTTLDADAQTTTISAADPMRLAFVGDTGTGGTQQFEVADLIAEYDDVTDFNMLVLLGDMIYEEGDPAWIEEVVLEPYQETLDGGTELMPVLGNHDVIMGAGDEIMAALGAPERWYSVSSELLHLIVLDSTQPESEAQGEFLVKTLEESESTWIVVALHHPPFSAGFHGSDQEIEEAFVPTFERYGVDLVLSGHEHDYQRMHPINGVTYVVSGAGAKLRPTGSLPFTATSVSVPHFLFVTVSDASIEAEAISLDGSIETFVVNTEDANS